MDTIDLNVNVARFNKAHMKHVVKERDVYKEKHERSEN